MSSALRDSASDIGVYLRIALRTLKIDAHFLCLLLEARPLPLWQPSLRVGILPGILGIETFGVMYLSLPLPRWHEYFCTTFCLLDYITCLLLLSLLGHTLFDQSLQIFIFIDIGVNDSWQLLLQTSRLLDVASVHKQTEIAALNLLVSGAMLIKEQAENI